METEDPQTAMMLTDTEWADLASICSSFQSQRLGWLGDLSPSDDLTRKLELCKRIKKAAFFE